MAVRRMARPSMVGEAAGEAMAVAGMAAGAGVTDAETFSLDAAPRMTVS
jgi:hypothetical protein